MNADKHISFNPYSHHLSIYDYNGVLPPLQEDFFLQYPLVKELTIHIKGCTSLPASFDTLLHLEKLDIGINIKTFPESISQMQYLRSLRLNSSNMDFNKEASRLATLPVLEELILVGYRGNTFPYNISLLQSLTDLHLPEKKKNTGKVPEIIQLIKSLPKLKKLDIQIGGKEDANVLLAMENIPLLDRLERLDYHNYGVSQLTIGLTRHVKMASDYGNIIPGFREQTANKSFSDFQLQVLFGLASQNITALNKLLPNSLEAAIREQRKVTLRLLEKLKGESMKSINEKLQPHGIKADNKADGEGVIVVIGNSTTVEQLLPFLAGNVEVITADQLKQVLVSGADHWLLQEENESSNTHLLQLLTSNQAENYALAFEIIATGGANKTIQSILAAVMLAHTDQDISKKATSLYTKFGSPSFLQHIKGSRRLSLRMGGDTDYKLNYILRNPDIDNMIFRFMHHTIAATISTEGRKTFSMKGVKGLSLPPETIYFTDIQNWHFEGCEQFDIDAAIRVLRDMPTCKELLLNKCNIVIPAAIGALTQLERLEIAYNSVEDGSILQPLERLTTLDVSGLKLKNWEWLDAFKQLETLCLGYNQLTQVPAAVFNMSKLEKLELKYNKLTKLPEELAQLSGLQDLDFSNNQISQFPYFLAKFNLSKLLLRSNKIAQIDTELLYAANGNAAISWDTLNLSRNGLQTLSFKADKTSFSHLDISHNQLTVLDATLFTSRLREFYANDNNITALPEAAVVSSYYDYFWIHNNQITELPAHFARTRIQNCDLSNNAIASIHPDFATHGAERYNRLYWKIQNNYLGKMTEMGGMYIKDQKKV
ncbi:leucine-rich repeat domain-containing protein [Chitinophaga sp. Cy-1792]|uniref:leucine-rich repeat domain-containing protein n=1 Tax=Chitinophaga sp. Cy-1792 TaxID=2608339 RepID=UPI001420B766|nr:leucine-rich repeat domain-containing protein [Chitinophaga sp. Cy-1792]NIG56729.1 leucine-rich repeat domain-containing protein [Chitinophaga sp. Cy-1792]